MPGRLKVGIAGHGLVGRRRHQFIDARPDLQVVAVSDQRYRGDYERPVKVNVYDGYEEMIEAENLDILFVCLPNHGAAEATMLGLRKGLHVFCEKPPGRDLADIRAVREVEKSRPGQKLKYGFNHRYHDSVRDAETLIRSGNLGRIVNMRGVYGKSVLTPRLPGVGNDDDPAYWRMHRDQAGGGILLDQGIHMVDLMRLYAGEFVGLKSFVANDFWNKDVEDNAYALMRTESGIVAMLHSSATQWRHRFSLEITLERGALTLAGILSSTKSYGQETLTVAYREDEAGGNPRETTTSYIHDNSWRDEIDDFAACISGNLPVTTGTSEDAYRTMELVFRIYCADDEWRNRYRISLD